MKHIRQIRLTLIAALSVMGSAYGVCYEPGSSDLTCTQVLANAPSLPNQQATLSKLNLSMVSGITQEAFNDADDTHIDSIAAAWKSNDPLSWVVEQVNWHALQRSDPNQPLVEHSTTELFEKPWEQTSGAYDDNYSQFDARQLLQAYFVVARTIGGANYYDSHSKATAKFATQTAAQLLETAIDGCWAISDRYVNLDGDDAAYAAYWLACSAEANREKSVEMESLSTMLAYVADSQSTLPASTVESCRKRYEQLTSAGHAMHDFGSPSAHPLTYPKSLETVVHRAQKQRSRSLSF